MFKKIKEYLNRRKNLRVILDILGAVSVWWGIWGILDLFIFPGNQLFSYIVSIIFGFIILLLVNENGLDDLK